MDICPGCAVKLPAEGGPTHPYIGSSRACWARFGELIAREFQDPAYFGVHQLTVDAYAVQHPGAPGRRTIQSVAVHLITLAMFIEEGVDPRHGSALHRRLVSGRDYEWLEPPWLGGRMTVLDALAAEGPREHQRLVRAWAEDVWRAWEPHHETVRRWIAERLGRE